LEMLVEVVDEAERGALDVVGRLLGYIATARQLGEDGLEAGIGRDAEAEPDAVRGHAPVGCGAVVARETDTWRAVRVAGHLLPTTRRRRACGRQSGRARGR